tara:strand:- start:2384 stop:3088 length:705 start_codon:yes stop_codon:yes gene_type:complete
MKESLKSRGVVACLLGVLFLAGCQSVPSESVELANTVGRDLEEIHRSHLALAELHFNQQINRANEFIDETYRPAYIEEFAREFRLADQVELIIDRDAEKLLPVLTRFVKVANERVEAKRSTLVDPIREQRDAVIVEINTAYRQVHAAQAVVTGHLASIRDVREVQNEMLAGIGLEGLPTRIASTTARVSEGVSTMIAKGEKLDRDSVDAVEKIRKLEESIEAFRKSLSDNEDQE